LSDNSDMFPLALGLGLATAVANVLGSSLAVLQRQPSRSFTAGALGFSGGFILAAALLEMLPASLQGGPAMPFFIALGYLLIFLIEQFLDVHLHTVPEETKLEALPTAAGLTSLIAFNVHDFLDGLAIGTGMITGAQLGVLVFIAVLLHETPAGFVIAAIVRAAGWGRGAAIAAGASLGLVTLVGVALPFWVRQLSRFHTDALLSVATGTFIYLGATLLVPLSETAKSRWITLLVVLGFVAFFAASWIVR
jgi:zinc and cadmium transporter